jgi:hypothetical protein
MPTLLYNPCRGGLGDSIIGLQSAFILSKVLEVDFKILNGSVNFFNYFEIPKKYVEISIFDHKFLNIDYEPNNKDLNKYFQFSNDLLDLKNRNILISSGSNFCQYLYLNKNLNIVIKQEEVIKILFQEIIIPKLKILNMVESYKKIYKLKEKICVHIRCNNKWSDSNSNEKEFKVDETIRKFSQCIRSITYEPVLLITDNLEQVKNIFQEENVLFFVTPGLVSHSLKSNTIDYEKTLLDLLLIGETHTSIISYWSNFSRIGVLRTLNTVYVVNPVLNMEKEKFNYCINFDQEFKNIKYSDIMYKENEIYLNE